MTRYTVTWIDEAQDRLAEIWLKSTDKAKISVATNQVDAELLFDPDVKGLATPGGIRELTIVPLRVEYVVDPGDRIVRIYSVSLSG